MIQKDERNLDSMKRRGLLGKGFFTSSTEKREGSPTAVSSGATKEKRAKGIKEEVKAEPEEGSKSSQIHIKDEPVDNEASTKSKGTNGKNSSIYSPLW